MAQRIDRDGTSNPDSNSLGPGLLPISTACLEFAFDQSSVFGLLALYAKEINKTSAASYTFIAFSAVLFLSRPPVGRPVDR